MSANTCKTCDHRDPSGECRRFPPTLDVSQSVGSKFAARRWPVVGDEDWCGEHSARAVAFPGWRASDEVPVALLAQVEPPPPFADGAHVPGALIEVEQPPAPAIPHTPKHIEPPPAAKPHTHDNRKNRR